MGLDYTSGNIILDILVFTLQDLLIYKTNISISLRTFAYWLLHWYVISLDLLLMKRYNHLKRKGFLAAVVRFDKLVLWIFIFSTLCYFLIVFGHIFVLYIYCSIKLKSIYYTTLRLKQLFKFITFVFQWSPTSKLFRFCVNQTPVMTWQCNPNNRNVKFKL